MSIRPFIKAARADFLPASVIPFLTGVFYAVRTGEDFYPFRFILGFAAVTAAHLSANLLNDYYDYKSGADNLKEKVSSFFGGSRTIQEGTYAEGEILKFSIFLLAVSSLCGLVIFALTRDPLILWMMVIGGILAVEYTAPPLRLSYRMFGELDIFILFGVGLVMGSFYLFSGHFTVGSFLVSLPIASLIAAVIICNEIPDYGSDIASGKKNLLSLSGVNNACILYGIVVSFSLLAVFLNIIFGILPPSYVYLIFAYLLGVIAFFDLKNGLADINRLIRAGRLTIIQHAIVGIMIIVGLLR